MSVAVREADENSLFTGEIPSIMVNWRDIIICVTQKGRQDC
jgi:hypothetical protein